MIVKTLREWISQLVGGDGTWCSGVLSMLYTSGRFFSIKIWYVGEEHTQEMADDFLIRVGPHLDRTHQSEGVPRALCSARYFFL